MLFQTRLTVLFFSFLFLGIAHAQSGFFANIRSRNVDAITKRLEEKLAKGKLDREQLFFTDKSGDSISVIPYSVDGPCKPCVEAFLAKRKQLEPYMDVQKELNISLLLAIENDDMPMFDYLIAQKADINYGCTSCYDRNTLLMSLANNRYAFFFKLLELGANPNAIDKKDRNALHMLFLMYERLDGVTGDALIKRTDTIVAIIDTLVNRGVSLQQKDVKGLTPLIMAAGTGDAVVFEHLRAKGATVQLDNPAEVATLLNEIMIYNQYAPGSTQKLYDKVVNDYQIQLSKALFDTRDLNGEYALLCAIVSENYGMFNDLMRLGVNVNVKNPENESALSLAVEWRSGNMAGKLLDAGAIVDVNPGKYTQAFAANTELLAKFDRARREQKKKVK